MELILYVVLKLIYKLQLHYKSIIEIVIIIINSYINIVNITLVSFNGLSSKNAVNIPVNFYNIKSSCSLIVIIKCISYKE